MCVKYLSTESLYSEVREEIQGMSGYLLGGFDPDAALPRRPQALLVYDRLHDQGPGSRHENRWHSPASRAAASVKVRCALPHNWSSSSLTPRPHGPVWPCGRRGARA